jgi:hypothetical protein
LAGFSNNRRQLPRLPSTPTACRRGPRP